MDKARKLGPNMQSLLCRKAALDAIPSGGGIAAGMETITASGKLAQLYRDALEWCDQAVAVMKSAPDNPYGDDEEVIAGAILAELVRHNHERLKGRE